MKIRIKIVRLFLLAALQLGAAGGIHAAAFSGIFAFGDSLTDTGNTSLASGGASPGASYYAGRYSNGPVWIERMAYYLGMPAPASSLSGGSNFAFGGAYTATGGSVPTLSQQAGMFMGGGRTFQATDLVVVWAGANDFLLGGQADPRVPAGHVLGVISTLAGAGARNFLVPNLPDLGDTPALLGTANAAASSQWSRAFNTSLAMGISDLRVSLGVTLWELDVYGIGKSLKSNPGDFGFTNVTESALLSGNAANASEYLYWDTVHPTARVHDIFGGGAAQLVPEPGVAWLVVMAGVAGCLRRRRVRGDLERSVA
jgi:phospholipase/lecithinase/hemolysin